MNNFNIIANEKCIIESDAVNQLKSILNLENVVKVVGLPDLHVGKTPVGMAVTVKNRIYPHLIGNDIGCGMMLIKTNIQTRKFKKDKIIKKLEKIESLIEVENFNKYEEDCPITKFGTIGGGNHFAEFQSLEKVFDQDTFNKLNFNADDIMLLVHSGSRQYGEEILKKFLNYDGYELNSKDGIKYLEEHNNALIWAKRNRKEIGDKLINYLGFKVQGETIIDCYHNFIEREETLLIHRKGAVKSEDQAIVIPGSRGSLTYIVMPTSNKELSNFSLSHGAGRKWPRNLCKGRLKGKYTKESIKETKLKSSVICHDNNLLYEEAEEAYKNIDNIIDCLSQYNLIKVIAVLKPIITFKG